MNSILEGSLDHEHFGSHGKGFTLTLQETRSVHDLMNRQISNLLLIFIFYIVCQVPISKFLITWHFLDILNYTRHNGGLGTAKTHNSRIKRHDDTR